MKFTPKPKCFFICALTLSVFANCAAASPVHVHGYMRKNGTYVAPYYRTSPNSTKADNYSTQGNYNPYTGAAGTVPDTPTYSSPAPVATQTLTAPWSAYTVAPASSAPPPSDSDVVADTDTAGTPDTLDNLVSIDDQHMAGLDTLTPDQREIVSTLFLKAFMLGEKQNGGGLSSGNAETSQIDGDFNGWDGNTVVKLVNGEVWQQTDYQYEYLYAYMPEIVIYPDDNGGYKMKMDDVDDDVEVERLK